MGSKAKKKEEEREGNCAEMSEPVVIDFWLYIVCLNLRFEAFYKVKSELSHHQE